MREGEKQEGKEGGEEEGGREKAGREGERRKRKVKTVSCPQRKILTRSHHYSETHSYQHYLWAPGR